MTIYVDDLAHRGMVYRKKKVRTCHMMTDRDDLTELHDMATRLGLRKYFQDHPDHPHYDLMGSKRAQAVVMGAVSVTAVEMVLKCSKRFKAPLHQYDYSVIMPEEK